MVLLLALAGAAVLARDSLWSADKAAAQSPRPVRSIPVEVATAEKKRVPVTLEALGSVTPIASVAIKARVESMIVGVHFSDGAMVREGDVLFTLDSRAIEAQIRQVEGVIAGAKAQLEQAHRDLVRYSDLLAKNASTQVSVNNATTQVNILTATLTSSQANLDNLRVQLDYHTIRAPISGRISAASVKVGNFVRPADTTSLAMIIQTAPVYVSFPVAQKSLPDVRQALAAETGAVEVTIPGEQKRAHGQVTMIENSVDVTTGMVIIRATMPNEDELLWPGTLVTTDLTLRIEDSVIVPAAAVQNSQAGSFVFVVKNGEATVRPVKVARTTGKTAVLESGLEDKEVVVTDGHLLLTNGTKVSVRERKAGA